MLNAKEAAGGGGGPKNYEPMLGTYPARLVGVVDLGLQAQRPYQGEEKPPAREVMLTFEFVDEFMLDEDGKEQLDKPRWISERMPLYNLKAERARSTQRYKALDPNEEHEGDWSKLLNTPCNVTIVQNPGKGKNVGKVYENIDSVSLMRAKDATKCPPLVNETVCYDLDNHDDDEWEKLSGWVKDIIKGRLDTEEAVPPSNGEAQEEANEDDERPY